MVVHTLRTRNKVDIHSFLLNQPLLWSRFYLFPVQIVILVSSWCEFEPASSTVATKNQVAMKSNAFAKAIFYLFFPLARAQSLLDLVKIEGLLGPYDLKSLLWYPIALILLLGNLLRALDSQFLLHLQPYRTAFSKISHLEAIGSSFTVFEVIILRIWCYFLLCRRGSMGQIDFIKMLDRLDAVTHEKMVYWARIICLEVALGGYIVNTGMGVIQIIYSSSFFEVSVHLVYCLGFSHICREFLNDLVILYFYALSGSGIAMRLMNQLNDSVAQYGQEPWSMLKILSAYFELIGSVEQLNSLAKMLVLSADILLIPVMAVVILIATLPGTGLLFNFAKFFIVAGVTIFCLLGYILISFLSQVDTENKKLRSLLHSTIVRGHHAGLRHVYVLHHMLEDVSCRSSRTVVREFNSALTQMDLFESFMSTFSHITLFFSFYGFEEIA